MPLTYQAIASVTVGAGGAASMVFSSIPATFTDLCVKFSARNTSTGQYAFYRFNNDATSVYSARILTGDGTSVTSISNTFSGNIANISTSTDTANTFGNGEIHIPNYTSSNLKSSSVDAVNENNATLAYANFTANLWSNTAAINRIDLLPTAGTFAQHSTATLYGIKKD